MTEEDPPRLSTPPDPAAASDGAPAEPSTGRQRLSALPEITVKAVVLGVVLSAVLGAANAYLGLLAGMTVSASIPAAVISMAVLRWFRRSNVLENNIVQTAASAGESLAAGVIFTFPALLVLGTWTSFDYVQTTTIALLGGLLGVLFTIPLRRALIVEAKLRFPEGLATADVLEVGQLGAKSGLRKLLVGGLLGGLFKLGESGLALWRGTVETARAVGSSVAYAGTSLAPALLGVGYIVGIRIAVLVFAGGVINWLIAIPILATQTPWPTGADGAAVSALEFVGTIHGARTKYIGVGAMIVGGLWAVLSLWPSLVRGIRSSIGAYGRLRRGEGSDVPRTERDTPIHWVALALVLALVPLFFLFQHITGSPKIAAVMAGVVVVAGFLFSAVAGYMAGVVGSSNNPVSGVTIATVLTGSLLLAALGMTGAGGAVAAILIGAVVCCAAAIGGDNLQDLKTGHLVGATPWKQQVMQAVGVLAAALVLAPVLTVLHKAYGIITPAKGSHQALDAPQAKLMASLTEAVFKRELQWDMIYVGAGLAAAIIVLDQVLRAKGSKFRVPVLAVAVGIYLPLKLSAAIFLGGLVSWAALAGRTGRSGRSASSGGVLLAAGLITGEALLGILLAVPIALADGKNPLAISLPGGPMLWPGVALAALVALALLAAGRRESGASGE